MGTTGITSNTPERQVFGPGVWVHNYDKTTDLSTQTINIMGATTGGTTLRIVQTMEDDRPDGGKGPFKDLTHITEDYAEAETVMKEIDLDTLLDMLPGASAASVGDVATITRVRDLIAADYLTNVAFVADHSEENEAFGFILLQALAFDNLEIEVPDKHMASGLNVKMRAHYDAADADTAPWEILFPSSQVVS